MFHCSLPPAKLYVNRNAVRGYFFCGWRTHWFVCMRPTNTGNISVTASNPQQGLTSAIQGSSAALRKRGNYHIVWMFEDCMRPSRLMTGTRK